ncbi:unnamed protein product [Acanthosepion pharaonis]|uniref:Uncharacterized protein n=1 Tax=Acanthosepion pharaonis TaxID=158019 RepID=A0A812BTJ7_ACAPH|nr:unnamed protein product [Sepia pharaonis]
MEAAAAGVEADEEEEDDDEFVLLLLPLETQQSAPDARGAQDDEEADDGHDEDDVDDGVHEVATQEVAEEDNDDDVEDEDEDDVVKEDDDEADPFIFGDFSCLLLSAVGEGFILSGRSTPLAVVLPLVLPGVLVVPPPWLVAPVPPPDPAVSDEVVRPTFEEEAPDDDELDEDDISISTQTYISFFPGDGADVGVRGSSLLSCQGKISGSVAIVVVTVVLLNSLSRQAAPRAAAPPCLPFLSLSLLP